MNVYERKCACVCVCLNAMRFRRFRMFHNSQKENSHSLFLSLWSFVVVPVTVTVFVYSFDRLAFAFHSCSLILLSSTPVVSSSFFRSFRLLWSVSCAENEFVYVGCQPCGFVEATTVCLSSILICAYPFKCRPKPLCVDGDGEKNNLQSNERTNRQT